MVGGCHNTQESYIIFLSTQEPQQSPSDKQVEEKSKIFTGAKGKP